MSFTEFWTPIKLSIEVALIAGIIAIVVGVLVGKFMAKRTFRGKVIIETIMLLPLVLPPTVIGFLLIIIFGKNSFVGQSIEWLFGQPIMFTMLAAIVASAVVAFPLMYQTVRTGFEAVDGDIENAARVDGASEWQIFFFITLPMAKHALIAGSILCFARALGEFGATLMFAGNLPGKTQTTPLAIYTAISGNNMTLAWLWVASMIILSFILLMSVHAIQKRDA